MAADPLPLHVEGNQILTSQACTIRLRGVNIAGLEYSNFGVGPSGVTMSQDFAISSLKSNDIRLPLNQDRWFGCAPGQGDGGASYRAIVDAVVHQANATGTYVELELHWSGTHDAAGSSSPCDGGGWGTATGQKPMPDANSVTFWASVAQRYANHPAVLFNLFNEPYFYGLPATQAWSLWQAGGPVTTMDFSSGSPVTVIFRTPGMKALLDTLRSAGASNLCVVNGIDWGFDLTQVDGYPITTAGNIGNGVAFASHIYSSKGGISNWNNKVTVATANHPVIIDEFGQGVTDVSNWDDTLLDWVDGNNANSYVYSAVAWDLSAEACPCLISNWNYTLTSHHGLPVSTWLAGISGTGTCPTWTPTPCGYPGPTCTSTPSPTPTPTSTSTATLVPSGPAAALPNLLVNGQTAVVFKVPEAGATLKVFLYTLAGELVAAIQSESGASRCEWDAKGMASGLYLAAVEITEADGSWRRQFLKVMVIH